MDRRMSAQAALIERCDEENPPTGCHSRPGCALGAAAQYRQISISAFASDIGQRMDGSGSLLCAVRILDHGDSGRHEEIRGLFQEFLCPALSPHLATVLFGAAFYVRDCPVAASTCRSQRVRCTVVAVVGLSTFPSEFPGSDSNSSHGALGCHLVAGG